MATVRVYELARELGIESKELMVQLRELGEFARSASSIVKPSNIARLRAHNRPNSHSLHTGPRASAVPASVSGVRDALASGTEPEINETRPATRDSRGQELNQSDLAAEQDYFDHAVHQRERHRERASTPTLGADPKASGAITRSQQRDSKSLQPPTAAPAFGKVALTDGDRIYVGYDRIHDDNQDLLVISWKTPAAEKFYEATPQRPMDVALKREFKCRQTTITSFSDVVLQNLAQRIQELEDLTRGKTAAAPAPPAPEPPAQDVSPNQSAPREPGLSDALLDAMEEGRTAAMHDIVTTIHASQYPIIRAPMESLLHVQGGPGTGKTVVALHRVSWLLYNKREELQPEQVLVVGPNTTFTSYISTVLPMLGDARVPQMAIQNLPGQGSPTREESLAVRRLKGDARMADLLRAAFEARQERLATRESPRALLQRILASPQTLLKAAGPSFSAAEIDMLVREPAKRVSDEQWSVEDLFLIDELAWMLRGAVDFTRYKHIVLDEAQDLSPMQLRAIARRSRNGSLTVLGDIAQSTGPWTRSDWADVFEHLPKLLDIDARELEYGYRLPAEIFSLAARLLPVIAPRTKPPAALRSGGRDPLLVRVGANELERRAVACAVEHFEEGKMVGLIVHSARMPEVAAILDRGESAWCFAEEEGLLDGINLVSPAGSKGLEFDVVVVVEPSEWATDLEGMKELYVAMTRPTQALDIIHSGNLDVLRERPKDPTPMPTPDPTDAALVIARQALSGLNLEQKEAVVLALMDECKPA